MLRDRKAFEYPDSDGTPMGENDTIVWLMACTLGALRQWFRETPDVYVSSNSFVYFEEGEPRSRVAPDLYFVRGVPNRFRRNFKIWEEGRAPQVVFEFTTRSSRKADLERKFELYERLGVQEYYVFDPEGEYLEPPFRAFRLVGAAYAEIPAGEAVHSPALGLDILIRGSGLAFRDPHTGQDLPTPDDVGELAARLEEQRRRADEEARRADEETRRADELQARVRQLEARIEQLRDR